MYDVSGAASPRFSTSETVLGVPLTRTSSPRKKPSGRLGFGQYFTDHVLVAEHDAASGQWSDVRIVPAGEKQTEIASGAVQYGLSIFEGLKAFRSRGGDLRLFRPDAHAKRFVTSARRLCMAEVDTELFVSWVRALVRVDGEWCGKHEGAALYGRRSWPTRCFSAFGRPAGTRSR